MRRLLPTLLCVFGLSAGRAQAAAFQVYDTQVLFANGDDLTGTITYNPATVGLVTGNLILTNGADLIALIQQTTVYATTLTSFNGPPAQQSLFFTTPAFDLQIVVPTPALLGYPGGPVCLVADHCLLDEYTAESYFAGYYQPPTYIAATSGTLALETATSPAPEPATFALLSGGLLALGTVYPRRSRS